MSKVNDAFLALPPEKQREVRAKVKKNLRVYVDLALMRYDEMSEQMRSGKEPKAMCDLRYGYRTGLRHVFPEWTDHLRGLVQQKKHPEPQQEWVDSFFEVAWVTLADIATRTRFWHNATTCKDFERLLWVRIHRITGTDETNLPLAVGAR